MSDDRRKPLWPWIVALLIGLPLLYVLSFGPACWLTSRMNSGADMVPVVWAPFVQCLSSRNMTLRRTVGQLSKIGAAPDWTWRPDDEIPIRSKVVMPEHWKWCNRWMKKTPEEERRVRAYFENMRNNK